MKTINIAMLVGLLATALILPSCTTPPWAIEAEKIAQVALPIVEGLTSIVGGGPAVTQAENDIHLLIILFDKYQATPAAGTLQQIQAALPLRTPISHRSCPPRKSRIAARRIRWRRYFS